MEIDLDERRAQIAQQQEIETLAAAQIAEIAQRKADSELSATRARIEMERKIQSAEVDRELALSIAQQDRLIAIAAKSQEESKAQVDADGARAEAVKAAEAVETARAMADAQRRADLARIAAEAEANTAAARAKIVAQSDKATAKDKADARREAAEAEKAVKIAEADANRARIEAENSRSDALVAMELEKARLEAMPRIVAEMVKPAEKIKSINVNHVTGLGGGHSDAGSRSPVTTAMDSIMEMAVQMPLLKKIGDQMGVSFDDVQDKKDDRKGK
jgi:uncharacterized membrane protein YqiK